MSITPLLGGFFNKDDQDIALKKNKISKPMNF